MSENEKKIQADALLSGYKEAKAEISRRSTLSWTAVAGYLLFLYRSGAAIADGDKNPVVWPVAAWAISFVAYIFVYTQYSAISGLSWYIRTEIEKTLRDICGAASDEYPLFGEGSYRRTTFKVLGKTLSSDVLGPLLLGIAFIIAPATLTLYSMWRSGHCFLLAVWLSVGVLVMTIVLCLLQMSPP